MKFRRLKHTFLRLNAEERVTLIGGLMVLLGSFLPWYQVSLKIEEQTVISNGFSGDIGILGFVTFIITFLGLLYLTGEHLGFRLPTFGYVKERVILFLMGQGAFLLLLSVVIYTKRSLDFTDAELRFGLYIALIGAVLATFSSYALIARLKKTEVEDFFSIEEKQPRAKAVSEEEEEELEEKLENEQMQLREIVEEEPEAEFSPEPMAEEVTEAEAEVEPAQDAVIIEEVVQNLPEAEVEEVITEISENTDVEPEEIEKIEEPESVAEEIAEVVEEVIGLPDEVVTGIGTEVESEPEPATELKISKPKPRRSKKNTITQEGQAEKPEPDALSMNFYED